MEYHTGDTLEMELVGLSSDGRAVGRSAEGMTVFVRGGVPGQIVVARLTAVKKRMAEAELVEVRQRAKEERPAPCPHAGSCGGCPWQILPHAVQLEWKRRIVQDSLQRIGRLHLPEERILPVLSAGEEKQWGYRNKMEFAFAANGEGRTLLGLRERSSRRVTEVTHCLLQSPRTMAVLDELRRLCEKYRLHAGSATEPSAGRYGRTTFCASPSSANLWPGAVLWSSSPCLPRRRRAISAAWAGNFWTAPAG